MIEGACDGENAFDVIVVHSFSRLFRDAFGLEFYVRRLAKHGVRLVSITQELGDEPAQVIRLFLSSVNRSSWYPWSTLARSELCKKRSR